MRQPGGLEVETDIEVVKLIAKGLVGQLKVVSVVGFGTEQSNFHETPPDEYVIKLHQWWRLSKAISHFCRKIGAMSRIIS